MISLTNMKKKHKGGFTLLELLIVISIIAILSIALVFMLNPAETLKKARDAQRISDLKTVKTALGIMLTASSTPSLDNFAVSGSPICLTSTTPAGVSTVATAAQIAYSAPTFTCTTMPVGVGADAGGTFAATSGAWCRSVASASTGKVDGTGWIPVNLKALTGGTPISSFPVDPINTVSSPTPVSTNLVYRYACQNGTSGTASSAKPAYVFEIDAQLESNAYTVDDDKRAKDGGDHSTLYEAGNSLNILPTGTDF